LKPELTVMFTAGASDKFLIVAFELTITVPLLMITSVFASGKLPQLQLPAFSQAVFMAHVQ